MIQHYSELHRRSPTWIVSIPLFLALVCSSQLARAERTGPEGAVRVGFGAPSGSPTGAMDSFRGLVVNPNRDYVTHIFPVLAEVGYRFAEQVFVGGYVQYGVGKYEYPAPEGCSGNGIDCSSDVIKAGIEAMYHPIPDNFLDVWFGFSVGAEWLHLRLDNRRPEATLRKFRMTASGFELANIQVGVDFPVTPYFSLGPAVSTSFGEYTDIDATCDPECSQVFSRPELDDSNPTIHGWLVLSARAVLVLGR